MDYLAEGFLRAVRLILSLDRELTGIILLSLKVSGLALVLATLLGLPMAVAIGFKRIPMRGFIVSLFNAFMGLPPVAVGLFVYLFLSRRGPLGFMGLLYTPSAMVIAQTILAFPIIVSLCHAALISVDPVIRQAARTLGATDPQAAIAVVKEARFGIMSGVMAALGRVMAEVGAILIVGGNIAGYTRVMTTTIAMETDKGDFELALALGIVLIGISLLINLALHLVQQKGVRKLV